MRKSMKDVEISTHQVIEEDAARAPVLLPPRQVEVLIAPLLVLGVQRGVVAVAHTLGPHITIQGDGEAG
jgi:hypothetical protein